MVRLAQPRRTAVSSSRVLKAPGENASYDNKNAFSSNQDELVLKQFAAARNNLDAQKNRGRQDLEGRLDRFRAVSGLKGGSSLKAEQKQLGEFEKQFAEAGGQIDAAEAQALQAAKANEEEKRFAAAEAAKGRNFQSQESYMQRAQQQGQFDNTLKFQKDSFADQMRFQFAEFNENLKTNMINAAIALRDAGLDAPGKVANIMKSLGNIRGRSRTVRY